MKSVSVVIPSLNSSTVAGVIDALLEQERVEAIGEILVVGLDRLGLVKEGPRVKFVSTQEPRCAAAARNIGLRLARSDLLIVLDADCFPAQGWLQQLLYRYGQGEHVVGGSITFEQGNYWTLTDNFSLFHEFMPQGAIGPRPYLPTANLLLDRGVLEATGWLDETFPRAAAEDIDWTIRMRKQGYRLFFEPEARVVHRPARTTLRDAACHFWWSGRSMSRVRRRYPETFPMPKIAYNPFWMLALAPAIGLWATLRLFSNTSGSSSYLHTAPMVYLTKVVWCLGAAWEIYTGDEEPPSLRTDREYIK